jgi:hypothetical protein
MEVPDKNLKELVDEKLTFIDSNNVEWVAPKGTLTDGASVPRYALWVTDGRYHENFLKAAVVHDAYCQGVNETRCPDQYHSKPWQEVHRMFYDACIACGTLPMKAKIMYFAVWAFGPTWNDPDRDAQDVADDMAILAVSAGKRWIEENDPTINKIEAEAEKGRSVLREFAQLQDEGLEWFRAGKRLDGELAFRRAESIITEKMEETPNDLMLANLKGYLHKNLALIYQGTNGKTAEELDSAEDAFKMVLAGDPKDPGALNGMGSVLIIRGELDQAEEYTRKALDIVPDYAAAQDGLKLIEDSRVAHPPK